MFENPIILTFAKVKTSHKTSQILSEDRFGTPGLFLPSSMGFLHLSRFGTRPKASRRLMMSCKRKHLWKEQPIRKKLQRRCLLLLIGQPKREHHFTA